MERYEKDARKNWDVFYKNNQDKFFKDRHYLAREFPHIFPEGVDVVGGGDGDDDDDDSSTREASDDRPTSPSRPSSNVDHGFDREARETGPAPRYVRPDPGDVPRRPRVFLEVGCGVGNTAFPLLELDESATVYCCDFSKRAVDLVRERRESLPDRLKSRIVPFTCDIVNEPLTGSVPRGSVDVCTMVFVLSAISPEKMRDAIRNVSSVMRPGGEGRVLLRDYASGDLAQERFAAKDGQKLAENFYVRGDGTRAYYFSPATLKRIFSQAGMALEELDVHERAITNRGQNVRMERRWVQASFASAHVPAEPLPPPPPPPEPEWARRRREAEARKAESDRETRDAESKPLENETLAVQEATTAIASCPRARLQRLVLGMVREGLVSPDTLVRRLADIEGAEDR